MNEKEIYRQFGSYKNYAKHLGNRLNEFYGSGPAAGNDEHGDSHQEDWEIPTPDSVTKDFPRGGDARAAAEGENSLAKANIEYQGSTTHKDYKMVARRIVNLIKDTHSHQSDPFDFMHFIGDVVVPSTKDYNDNCRYPATFEIEVLCTRSREGSSHNDTAWYYIRKSLTTGDVQNFLRACQVNLKAAKTNLAKYKDVSGRHYVPRDSRNEVKYDKEYLNVVYRGWKYVKDIVDSLSRYTENAMSRMGREGQREVEFQESRKHTATNLTEKQIYTKYGSYRNYAKALLESIRVEIEKSAILKEADMGHYDLDTDDLKPKDKYDYMDTPFKNNDEMSMYHANRAGEEGKLMVTKFSNLIEDSFESRRKGPTAFADFIDEALTGDKSMTRYPQRSELFTITAEKGKERAAEVFWMNIRNKYSVEDIQSFFKACIVTKKAVGQMLMAGTGVDHEKANYEEHSRVFNQKSGENDRADKGRRSLRIAYDYLNSLVFLEKDAKLILTRMGKSGQSGIDFHESRKR